MKKINTNLGEHFPPVKFYYEDMLEIYKILNEDNQAEMTIEIDNYKLESIEEILEIDKALLSRLLISRREPYISIEITKNKIWLYTNNDTALNRGFFEQIKNYLQSKTTLFGPLIQNPTLSGMYLGTTAWWYLLDMPKISIFVLITGLYWIYLYVYSNASVLIPAKKESRPNFFTRNKDKIILGVLSSLGTMAMMYLAQYFGLAIK